MGKIATAQDINDKTEKEIFISNLTICPTHTMIYGALISRYNGWEVNGTYDNSQCVQLDDIVYTLQKLNLTGIDVTLARESSNNINFGQTSDDKLYIYPDSKNQTVKYAGFCTSGQKTFSLYVYNSEIEYDKNWYEYYLGPKIGFNFYYYNSNFGNNALGSKLSYRWECNTSGKIFNVASGTMEISSTTMITAQSTFDYNTWVNNGKPPIKLKLVFSDF